MKKIVISILALAALVSCSKAALDNEAAPLVKGESISVNLPAPTKAVTVSDHEYQFQGGESLIVVSSEGKIATLTNTAESPYSFSGEFDGALGADSDSFTVYFNCYSSSAKALSFSQNGQPWLTASLSDQTRGEDGHYSLSPVLEAVEGVRTVAIVSDYAGTVSFHAKTVNISSYSGGAFSGSKDINDLALTADNNGKYTAFVNIPSGMTGGYWIKVTKEGESGAMYKSYATSETISENKQVTLSEFIPVKVNLDVAISGFYTSYSYYIGNEGVEKNISTANSTANTAMGAGEASYTVSFSGISSKLLSFSSFKLNVAGTEYTGSEGQKISANASTQSSWGQKNIVATVVYKSIDGVEFTASKTITRYITGLPYTLQPNNSDWTSKRDYVTFESGYVKMNGSSTSKTSLIESKHFYLPQSTLSIKMSANFSIKANVKKIVITYAYGQELKAYIGGNQSGSTVKRTDNGSQQYSGYTYTGNLTSAKPYVEFEAVATNVWNSEAYCSIYSTTLQYN